ncbi:MAG TPA: hypothetical protein VJ506_04380 [Candidatus Limnocylindrales bacterium]|nr:hypothetical protein [Candidatus Limnocylindrales bacterium]
MSFLERARQAAEQARQTASEAGRAVGAEAERTAATLRDPATAEKARQQLHVAKRGLATALERIDPGVLADVIIKATILQEKANAALQRKDSPYRIAEIAIGASIPPSVTFSIARIGEPTGEPAVWQAEQAEAGDSTITALDGTTLDDADLAALAGTPPP